MIHQITQISLSPATPVLAGRTPRTIGRRLSLGTTAGRCPEFGVHLLPIHHMAAHHSLTSRTHHHAGARHGGQRRALRCILGRTRGSQDGEASTDSIERNRNIRQGESAKRPIYGPSAANRHISS